MIDQEQIRRDQIEQGRKMGRLSLPESDKVGPDFARPRCKSSPAKSLTGHEAYVENLRASGAEVKIYLAGGTPSSIGVVRAADKYTISIVTADGTVEMVFKSNIVKLVPTKRGAKKDD